MLHSIVRTGGCRYNLRATLRRPGLDRVAGGGGRLSMCPRPSPASAGPERPIRQGSAGSRRRTVHRDRPAAPRRAWRGRSAPRPCKRTCRWSNSTDADGIRRSVAPSRAHTATAARRPGRSRSVGRRDVPSSVGRSPRVGPTGRLVRNRFRMPVARDSHATTILDMRLAVFHKVDL